MSESEKKAPVWAYILLFIIGMCIFPTVTIIIGLLALIGFFIQRKQKKTDDDDLKDIKDCLKKDGHL